MNVEKQNYQDALNNLRDAEAKIANLESRSFELKRKQESAADDVAAARLVLEQAIERAALSGDETALLAARKALAKARQEHDTNAEQLEALGRVIKRSKEEIPGLVKAGGTAHAQYWGAVLKQETERCAAAAQQILRTYRVYVASVCTPRPLDKFLFGSGVGEGLFGEIGLTAYDAKMFKLDSDMPQSEPFSSYAPLR